MNSTVRILVFGFLAMTLSQVTGCAGGRKKQAVTVQPAPGSNSGQSGEQQQGATPQGEQKPETAQEGEEQQSQTGAGETTDLEINAELDNGDGTTTAGPATTTNAGPWDGKSFKGSGKWKVTPVN